MVCYYLYYPNNNKELQNYLFAIIKGNIRFEYVFLFDNFINVQFEYKKINLFCKILDLYNLNVDDFNFCVLNIIKYINNFEYNKNELKNINYFMKCISKIYYENKKKKLDERRMCLRKILNTNNSQLFMEYLDYYYYKYLAIKFAPGSGPGYIKTKKHFESIVALATK
jgi:hypothetical protein